MNTLYRISSPLIKRNSEEINAKARFRAIYKSGDALGFSWVTGINAWNMTTVPGQRVQRQIEEISRRGIE